MSTPRPTADTKLGKRGQLKVYLGYAPGVGKSFRLLQEAQALLRQGVDVVIGVVEARGRTETAALTASLPQVPQREFNYHGVTVCEMDVEAIAARQPRVVIVDDLLHTNVPGSKHNKRYQDVLFLLDRGIDVLCACDVAHLESVSEVVARLSTTRVRATVPESFFKQADQVVMIDLDVDALRDRLAGKIEKAQEEFFAAPNLTMLRELALREVAESLERAAPKKSWGGKLMVCLSSNPPHARTLLRRGSRLAGRLRTDWYVVYVETPREAPNRIDAAAEQQLAQNIELAKELGAEVIRLRGADPVQSLLDFARTHGVSDVVIGRGADSLWRLLIGTSFTPRMVEQATGLDLHIVSFMDKAISDDSDGNDREEKRSS